MELPTSTLEHAPNANGLFLKTDFHFFLLTHPFGNLLHEEQLCREPHWIPCFIPGLLWSMGIIINIDGVNVSDSTHAT